MLIYGWASGNLAINKKESGGDLEINDRKALRKFLDPKQNGKELRKRSNKQLYVLIIITFGWAIKKRIITLYGHLVRMKSKLLTKRINDYFDKHSKSQFSWFTEVKTDRAKKWSLQKTRYLGQVFFLRKNFGHL